MINKNFLNGTKYKFASKNSRGITLIALVVTIVVLLILATISINAAIGDSGIIRKTRDSKQVLEKSTTNQEIAMKEFVNEMAEDEESPDAGTTVAKPETWTSTNVTPISDGNGGTVPLPNGFYYVGGDKSTGLVISDKQGDKLTSSGTGMGNQFVWIPVSGVADLARTEFDSNGHPTASLEGTNYEEPYENGYSTEKSEYATMKTQVLKYGGFYIGRFEAGVNTTTFRTESTTVQAVVCKKGVAPYNVVPWGESMTNIGTRGAVYLAKNMYSSSNSVTSTLTYGCQWDAMCRYIGDSQRTTPEKSEPELTGSVEKDVSKNIYDLAGNCVEWTMEAQDAYDYRVIRGGIYSIDEAVSGRGGTDPNSSYESISFRPTLYIK